MNTKVEKTLLIALAFLILSYWWFSKHIWFRIDDKKITVNRQSKPYDYSCFKSLSSQIFCHHQDNGTQYLIVPKNNEIYAVEGEDIVYLEGIVISSTFSNTLKDSEVIQKLPDEITKGENFIQFTPSVDEARQSQQTQTWRIYN